MNLRTSFADKITDPDLRRKMARSMGSALSHRQERMAEVPEWEALRDSAHAVRTYGVTHMDELLTLLEEKLTALGVHVHWAQDARAANEYIIDVARKMGVDRLVKGKTMTSEETGLNAALRQAGIEPVETDLGEYLIQLAGDAPSHITAPAVHLSRQDCGDLICSHLDLPYTDDPAALTGHVRDALRQEFLQARLGVSGANFIVADTGTIVICDNEANQGLVTALPEVHIALVGIDKIVPRLADLAPLLRLLARNSTGQTLTTYTTMITGPRRAESDADGPGELHVVLLDNGRTDMLGDPNGRAGLMCIRCGTCCNICPIYSKVGGHPYGYPYPGSIGTIWSRFVAHSTDEMPFVCTLCRACRDVCPVKIDLAHHNVALRGQGKARRAPLTERLAFRGWSFVMTRPGLYRLVSRLLRPAMRLAPLGRLRGWMQSRELPHLPHRSFFSCKDSGSECR